MVTASSFLVDGRPIPADLLRPLGETTDTPSTRDALREKLATDGYLLLRGFLSRELVVRARNMILRRLAAVDEIREPASEAVATGKSRRAEEAPDLGAFWRELSEMPALRELTHGAQLNALMADLLVDAATPFDFVWLRAVPPGRASPLHYDHVYMNRGSQRVLTCWIPLGDIPATDGPLLVVEGSHRFDDLIARFRGHDVDVNPSMPGHLDASAITLARQRDCSVQSTSFKAGDIVIFGMFLLHGSCDNASPSDRVRLSCDVRYQAEVDARDPRWFGNPPPGHGGKSYGGLSAAQPLTSPPISR